jgi:hypothetical protein
VLIQGHPGREALFFERGSQAQFPRIIQCPLIDKPIPV